MIEILSKSDLREFKIELLSELSELMKSNEQTKEVMRTKDVLDFLGVSQGTLQQFRIKGLLPFKKVGGVIYYRKEDVLSLVN